MKMRIFFATILLATGVVTAPTRSVAQSTRQPAEGRILDLKCEARLIQKPKESEVALHSPRDIGRDLRAGNRIRCLGAGSMQVLIPEGPKKLTADQGWLEIQPVPLNSPFPDIARALERYGIPGASRGTPHNLRILWPSENSVVLPEHFAIRWRPIAQKIELAILSEAKDVTLIGPTEVDGEAGSLQSDAIVSALAAYKAKPGSQGLVLTWTLANSSNWEDIPFSLLRGKQEQELNAQLDFWQSHTEGLALLLGRGYTFMRYKLFEEAAEEYDSALNTAPESPYLLKEAIDANSLAGRASRVKDLQARQASLTETPN